MIALQAVDPEILSALQDLGKTAALTALGLISTALTIGAAYLSKRLISWIEAKQEKAKADARTAESTAHLEAFKCVSQKLDTWSTNAIRQVEQTVVRKLKRENNWNAETAKMALDTAVDVMKQQAGNVGMNELQQCTGHAVAGIESMFRTWIEAKNAATGTGSKSPISPIVTMPDA
jgi:hypothetical protein